MSAQQSIIAKFHSYTLHLYKSLEKHELRDRYLNGYQNYYKQVDAVPLFLSQVIEESKLAII